MIRPQLLRLAFFAAVTSAALAAQVEWTQVAASGAPAANCGSCWDSGRARLVAFGGELAGVPQQAMREWDGSQWLTLNPAQRPSPRTRPAMAFDEARGVTVLFGGGPSFSNEIWTWDGTTWTQRLPAAAPSPRFGAAMAYDRARQVVVLFGGFVPSGLDASDTWEWNGTNWTQRSPAGAVPAARGAHRMVYDQARGVSLMCGGYRTTQLLTVADAWTWNGTAWTQVAALPTGTLCDHHLAYDPTRQRVVSFGGLRIVGPTLTDLDGLGEWNGTAWTTRAPAPALSARNGAAHAFDPGTKRLLVAGGAVAQGTAPPAATWSYGPVSPASVTTFGSACLTSLGPIDLVEQSLPYLGLPFIERIVGAPSSALLGIVVFGQSNSTWLGLPLPLDLSVFGAFGCELLVSADVLVTVPVANGTGTMTWVLPSAGSVLGAQLFLQGGVLDPASPLPFQIELTSGRAFVVGAP